MLKKKNVFRSVRRSAIPVLCVAFSQLALAESAAPITIYGFLNAELESVVATGGATPYARRGRVSDGNSRLGFTSEIDLEDGLKAIWQIEGGLNSYEQGGVNDAGSSTTLTSRNTFVGIQHDKLGRLIIGYYDSAYRSLVGSGGDLGGNQGLTTHGLDLWNNTNGELSGNSATLFGRGEARYKNSIHYLSPLMSGFQAAASYGFDETQTNNLSQDRYAVGAKYSQGEFKAGVGYDHMANTGVDLDRLQQGFGFGTTNQPSSDVSFFRLTASYTLPTQTYIGIGMESASYGYSLFTPPSGSSIYPTVQSGHMVQDAFMVSVAQDFKDRISLMLSYGKLGSLSNVTVGNPDDYKATQTSFGATYKYGARTLFYINFTQIDNASRQNVNLGVAPIYTNNLGTSSAYLAPGNSPRSYGIGLLLRF